MEEGLSQIGIRGQVGRQEAYSSDLDHRLGFGGERCGEEPASQTAQECPPMHYWITSSARDSSDCGIVKP